MNDITLENFISFCDDMKIAEESVKEMNNVFYKEKEKLTQIKNQINDAYGDIKKQISLYNEMIKELQSLKNVISKMDESKFEKSLRYTTNFISLMVPVTAAISVGKLTHSAGLGATAGIGTIIGLGAASLNHAKNKRERNERKEKPNKISKKYMLVAIDNSIDGCNKFIKILSDPKYKKYLPKLKSKNGESFEDELRNSRNNYNLKNGKPIVEKIIKFITSELKRHFHALNLEAKFDIKRDNEPDNILLDYRIYTSKEFDKELQNINNGELEEKICEFVDKTVNDSEAKFSKEIKEYQISIQIEPDQLCAIYLEM